MDGVGQQHGVEAMVGVLAEFPMRIAGHSRLALFLFVGLQHHQRPPAQAVLPTPPSHLRRRHLTFATQPGALGLKSSRPGQLVVCRARRAWLPPSSLWVFKPLSYEHDIGEHAWVSAGCETRLVGRRAPADLAGLQPFARLGMAPMHAEMAVLVADTSLYGCLKPSHCPVSAAVIHKQAAGAWSGRVMRTRATLPGWTQPCLC